jgi:hypothetical protein
MNHETLERHIKKTTIVSNVLSIISALFVAMGVGYGFYYNTKSTLLQHTTELVELNTTVRDVESRMNDIDVFQGVSNEKFEVLESKVNRVDQTVTKMDDKLDQLLLQTRR